MYGREQLLRHRCFGERQQQGFIHRCGRALRFGIEFADGFNLIAEEIEAHGAIHLRRIDVENAAAARELARHLDDIHLRVADALQMRRQHLDVDFFTAPQDLRQSGIIRAIEEAHTCCLDRRNYNRHTCCCNLPQYGCALFQHIGVGRKIFEWEHVMRGQPDDAFAFDGARQLGRGAEHLHERFGSLVIGNQHDDGRLRSLGKIGEIERPAGRRKSRHTTAPGTKVQMPSHTFKTRGVLQVRKRLADKGENHASTILPRYWTYGRRVLCAMTGSLRANLL